ncbi:hypothetical protein [Streptomyces sp. C36]|uniref:hypothetical protein n=1 Tax=Streptomyces sp. C36 TaxID=3237122 RepID=UPI0034C66C9D
MPRDSAINRDLHGEAVEWDASTHLLAAITDHLSVANWLTTTINSGEDAEPLDYPEPVPRPGLPDPEDEPASGDEAGTHAGDATPASEDLARFFGPEPRL